MADRSGSISLLYLLSSLPAEHVPKEVEFQEAEYRRAKASRFAGDELEGDPPVWGPTPWDRAVRWLAQRSAYFHKIETDFDEPIEEYERLLREYLADLKLGGPTRSNPVVAELVDFDRRGLAAKLSDELGTSLSATAPGAPKGKRSTEKGEAQIKLVAALTKHHKYADNCCLIQEPIGNNELARQAKVDQATASAFFKRQFGSHAKYRHRCTDFGALVDALKTLNNEFTPAELTCRFQENAEAVRRILEDD